MTRTSLASPPAQSRRNLRGPTQADTRCRQCGYLLRGLDLSGNCPECGTPIVWSEYDGLVHSNLPWLRSITLGIRLIFWGTLAPLVVFPLSVCVLILISFLFSGSSSPSFELAAMIAVFLGPGIAMTGIWFATIPEPGVSAASGFWKRWITRVAALGGLADCALLLNSAIGGTFLPENIFLLSLVSWGCRVVAFVGLVLTLEPLFVRAYDNGGLVGGRDLLIWLAINAFGWILPLLLGLASPLAILGALVFCLWLVSCFVWLMAFLVYLGETAGRFADIIRLAVARSNPTTSTREA
jgi:hypothetical protein